VPIRHLTLSPRRVTHYNCTSPIPSVFGHKPTSRVTCSFCKSTSDHLLCSVYDFGTRLQAHCGSLALIAVYAFVTRQQAHCGSLALFYLSMLSALDRKPTVGHLLCSLSMLSALDNKPTVGHLFCSTCLRLLYRHCVFGTSQRIEMGEYEGKQLPL
jgi:hypothetical protein